MVIRQFLVVWCLVSTAAFAKKPPMIVLTTPKAAPTSVKVMSSMFEKEKPGPAQRNLFWMMESKLREKGAALESPEDADALTELMFDRIFSEMAAPTDVFSWSKEEAPRGEVLLREKIKLFPGQNTTKFVKSFTQSPRGKRIDRAFADSPLTIEVSVAKSETEFYATLENSSSSYWGAAMHPVLVSENVARVVVQLFSPGRGDPPAAVHQRPIWLALFRRASDSAPWQVLDFAPAVSQFQKVQESNALPSDVKEKLNDTQRQLVLNLRLADVRYLNPSRKVLTAHELSFVMLMGLNGESPVDEKKVAWLEPYKLSQSPMVRAVAILRTASLGGAVTPNELVSVIESVKALPIQIEADGALKKLLESGSLANAGEKSALTKNAADVVHVLNGFALVTSGNRHSFYKNMGDSWKLVVSK